jgi:ribonuclease HIII
MQLEALEAKMKLAIKKGDSKEVDKVLSELVNAIPNLGVNAVIRVQNGQ